MGIFGSYVLKDTLHFLDQPLILIHHAACLAGHAYGVSTAAARRASRRAAARRPLKPASHTLPHLPFPCDAQASRAACGFPFYFAGVVAFELGSAACNCATRRAEPALSARLPLPVRLRLQSPPPPFRSLLSMAECADCARLPACDAAHQHWSRPLLRARRTAASRQRSRARLRAHRLARARKARAPDCPERCQHATRSCLPRTSPVTLAGSSSASRSCMRRLGRGEFFVSGRFGRTPQGKFGR